MKSNHSVQRAILAVLGTTTAATFGSIALAADATTNTTTAAAASDTALEEVVVTATRRAENLQDVPISVQALTSETLSQLHIETFDDMVKYLPNVTAPSNGPGQGNIFMRGLSVGQAGSQSSGTIGQFPNVAIYLDEQSGQLPARNLDVYAADLQRVEILEGPQGTLFGAGAEAGVVRYITNKPVLDKTEGSFDAGAGVTAHGDPNSNITAVFNLPLIENTFAVRAVIYDDRRGGYIDNVPGTFTRKSSDLGIGYAYDGGQVPANSPVINNYSIAGRAINPVTYEGMRVEALYKINQDWGLPGFAVVSEHGLTRCVLPDARLVRWRRTATLAGHAVQRFLRQG